MILRLSLIFLFFSLVGNANAGVITEVGSAYTKIVEINYKIQWGFLFAASSLLIAMFASFGKVAGKLNSKILKVPVAIAYILGEFLCIIFILLQFEEAIVDFFDFIVGLF